MTRSLRVIAALLLIAPACHAIIIPNLLVPMLEDALIFDLFVVGKLSPSRERLLGTALAAACPRSWNAYTLGGDRYQPGGAALTSDRAAWPWWHACPPQHNKEAPGPSDLVVVALPDTGGRPVDDATFGAILNALEAVKGDRLASIEQALAFVGPADGTAAAWIANAARTVSQRLGFEGRPPQSPLADVERMGNHWTKRFEAPAAGLVVFEPAFTREAQIRFSLGCVIKAHMYEDDVGGPTDALVDTVCASADKHEECRDADGVSFCTPEARINIRNGLDVTRRSANSRLRPIERCRLALEGEYNAVRALRRARDDGDGDTGTDIGEHLRTLHALAKLPGVRHITEFGVRDALSTAALVSALPARQVSYDVDLGEKVRALHARAQAACAGAALVDFRLVEADVLAAAPIEETDLLFIDTLHTGEHLLAELRRHAHRVARFIVLHDTAVCGAKLHEPLWSMLCSSTEHVAAGRADVLGLQAAVDTFLAEQSQPRDVRYEVTVDGAVESLPRNASGEVVTAFCTRHRLAAADCGLLQPV